MYRCSCGFEPAGSSGIIGYTVGFLLQGRLAQKHKLLEPFYRKLSAQNTNTAIAYSSGTKTVCFI
tara:strand:+ start:2693 stop:2887 length:195 start_codon:yes stop_codon:yes gene_type:complete